MNKEDLKKLAAESYAAYMATNEPTDIKDYYLDGYVAGAMKMAEYIGNTIKFMAENNPPL